MRINNESYLSAASHSGKAENYTRMFSDPQKGLAFVGNLADTLPTAEDIERRIKAKYGTEPSEVRDGGE